MIRDVIFNDEISAYNDWNIVLTKSEIPFPEVKTSTVDIKGADGILDLSEIFGEVKYKNRNIKLTFELLDDTDYEEFVSRIGAYLHGKTITFQFTTDPLYYYTGRASLNKWECVKRKGEVVIGVDCEPYKYRVNETIINVDVQHNKTVILTNERQRVYPTLSVQGNVTMTWNDTVYEMSDGIYKLLTFYLVEGENVITLQGNGSVKFTYRMGAL